MIVDADAGMRALLHDVLERDGFDVREDSGSHMVPMLERRLPDAIVLEKQTAGPNGLDLLSYIRERHPGLTVIVVTALGGTEVAPDALKRAATYYIDPPFRVARLLTMLRAALRQAAHGPASRQTEYG